MDALQSRAAMAEREAAALGARRGGALVWSVVASWVPLELVALVGQLSRPMAQVVRVALTGFVLWRAMTGSAGARRYLAFASGAAFLLALGMLFGADSVFPRIVWCACLLTYGFAAWVFGFSADARAYLESTSRK